jgi:hypothetical protein
MIQSALLTALREGPATASELAATLMRKANDGVCQTLYRLRRRRLVDFTHIYSQGGAGPRKRRLWRIVE